MRSMVEGRAHRRDGGRGREEEANSDLPARRTPAQAGRPDGGRGPAFSTSSVLPAQAGVRRTDRNGSLLGPGPPPARGYGSLLRGRPRQQPVPRRRPGSSRDLSPPSPAPPNWTLASAGVRRAREPAYGAPPLPYHVAPAQAGASRGEARVRVGRGSLSYTPPATLPSGSRSFASPNPRHPPHPRETTPRV